MILVEAESGLGVRYTIHPSTYLCAAFGERMAGKPELTPVH